MTENAAWQISWTAHSRKADAATAFMELMCAVLDIAQTRKREAAVSACAWLTRPVGAGADAGVCVE